MGLNQLNGNGKNCVELKQNVVEKKEIILEFDGEDHIRERHMDKGQEFI